ncbi:MAG: Stp1/IreP family PP2C-type Ser/Thr phosphatase [Acidobacteriota bacterium]
MLRLEAHGSTDVGLLRTVNEDYFDISERDGVYVVADGMGGHNHGEVASQIAVETILDFIAEATDTDSTLPVGYDAALRQHSNQLKHSIHLAHDEVLNAIRRDTSLVGMGTTVVGAIYNGDVLALAHVGDSRAYRLRDGHLELLTQDHTWVNEQVVAGYLSEDQAKSHPLKNVITRALGGETEVVVDVLETEAQLGDLFLLCSDGLTTMLSDQEIHQRLVPDQPLEATCRRLIHDANARGGFDNVTVVLLRVIDDAEEMRDPATVDLDAPEVEEEQATQILDMPHLSGRA